MKRIVWIPAILLPVLFAALLIYHGYFYQDPFYFMKGSITVENLPCKTDKDRDGISDKEDIVAGARQEVNNKTEYRSAYYEMGYPPENEGVCTDVVWRALKNAGYNLKSAMDQDIAQNLQDYTWGVRKPDPNIDFRRVKNQFVFFKKYALNLTTAVIPFSKKNLIQWQPGDIVVLKNPEHIAIISDRRRKDGIPYVLHNASDHAREENMLMHWSREKKIIGHFRYPKESLE